jgi:hypothetical protein
MNKQKGFISKVVTGPKKKKRPRLYCTAVVLVTAACCCCCCAKKIQNKEDHHPARSSGRFQLFPVFLAKISKIKCVLKSEQVIIFNHPGDQRKTGKLKPR